MFCPIVIHLSKKCFGTGSTTYVIIIYTDGHRIGSVPLAVVFGHISMILHQNVIVGTSFRQFVFGIIARQVLILRQTIGSDAGVFDGGSRQKTRPGRYTNCAMRVGIAKVGTFAGDPIEGGCVDVRMFWPTSFFLDHANGIVTLLIGEDDDEIVLRQCNRHESDSSQENDGVEKFGRHRGVDWLQL